MSFLDSLQKTIKVWISGNNEDEWIFENFRKTEISNLDSAEAFSLINESIPILLNEINSEAWSELFETIIALARKSKTTEVPKILLENWSQIKSLSNNQGEYSKAKFDELARYYRMDNM